MEEALTDIDFTKELSDSIGNGRDLIRDIISESLLGITFFIAVIPLYVRYRPWVFVFWFVTRISGIFLSYPLKEVKVGKLK